MAVNKLGNFQIGYKLYNKGENVIVLALVSCYFLCKPLL